MYGDPLVSTLFGLAIISLLLTVAAALVLLMLTVLGVLWVPVGRAICGFIAQRRGLEVRPWIWRAAKSSALAFLPWTYTVARVSGVRVPSFLVWTAYVMLYSVWFAGPMITMLMFGIVGIDDIDWDRGPDRIGRHPVFLVAYLALAIANVATWFMSLITMWRNRFYGAAEFDGVYMWPWFLMMAWSAAASVFSYILIDQI